MLSINCRLLQNLVSAVSSSVLHLIFFTGDKVVSVLLLVLNASSPLFYSSHTGRKGCSRREGLSLNTGPPEAKRRSSLACRLASDFHRGCQS